MKFLVTGHTGFKGSWLSMMLKHLGHDVSGISLNPLANSLFEKAELNSIFCESLVCDIRDSASIDENIAQIQPDFIFHLAAQPLVINSYMDPRGTFETNVTGTLNLLSAATKQDGVKGFLSVTTDKVYRDYRAPKPHTEESALGGDDPYSASKAMADIMTQSWALANPNKAFAVARAGNVIGGGDVSPMRLITDITNAYKQQNELEIRNPDSVRPWQHVLDCLRGYILLSEKMMSESADGVWNFGPDRTQVVTVKEIVEKSEEFLGQKLNIRLVDGPVTETKTLLLDSTKAKNELKWSNQLAFPESLEWTIDWYREVWKGHNARQVTENQIDNFLNRAS